MEGEQSVGPSDGGRERPGRQDSDAGAHQVAGGADCRSMRQASL